MARVEMLHGTSQPIKAMASQIIVSLTLQTEAFREILQSQYSTII